MVNKFCKYPLEECTVTLAAVALGIKKADVVIKNAKLVNVCTKEIIEGVDVAVAMGRIALVGDASQCVGENTAVYDATGKYLAPAFLDGHMHIESSMMTVGEYAKAAVAHGTGGVFFDPHEICNVCGLEGVKCMVEDSKRTPLKAMLTVPSCVPAVTSFEDTGSKIDASDIAETMKWDEVVGLGEMMSFPGILYGEKKYHDIVGETLKADKVVTGHYSVPDTAAGLNAYISAGIRCCHESVTEESALAKMRLGMYAQLREGSAWHDLKEVAKAVTKHEVDSRFACLVSDDNHPHTLVEKGHLDYIVKRAIEEGIDPISAIQMVTINTATCFRLEHEMGSVTPSKCADMVLITDLENCVVDEVFIDGELVAKKGKMIKEFNPYAYPDTVKNTVHLNELTAKDFRIEADGDVKVRTIKVGGGKTITEEEIVSMTAKNSELCSDVENDLLKICVFERHHGTGNVGKGFVKGFGIKYGALAQTVAHDAHNLLVIGTNDEDMTVAANALIACGGGLVAVKDGKVIALVELPIAGLMSESPVEVMNEKISNLENAWRDLGCTLPSPFMTNSGISLACIPNLRLTDKGLVDCVNFKFVDLIVKD